jgi:hypothetical protein
VAVLIACAPVLAGGFPAGHDWIFELTRVAEYRNAMAEGQLLPFWASNLYGGYGSPVFLFYAPGYALLATVCGLLPGGITAAAAIAVVVTTAIGAASMGILAREAVPDHAAARCAVVVFVLSPYLLGDALIRNANAEYLGLCVAPLALAGLISIDRTPRRGAILLALGLGGVLLTHNLTALFVAAGLVLGTVVLHPRGRRTWVHLSLGGVVGGLLGAVLWLPALMLKPLVSTDGLLSGDLDFHTRFPPLSDWIVGDFFSVGVPVVVIFGAAIGFWLRSEMAPRTRRLLRFACVAAAACLALQLKASTPLWEHVPLLKFFQFPWRFMGPISLLGALLAAVVLAPAFRRATPGRRIAMEVAVLAICVASAAPNLLAYRPLDAQDQEEADWRLTADAIRNSTLTVTVGDEYLPRDADPERWRTRHPANGLTLEPPGVGVDVEVDGLGTRIRVETQEATALPVGRWAFPVWELHVDGRDVTPLVDADGALEIPVPSGGSSVELVLRPPPVRRVGAALSLLGLLGLIGLLRLPGRLGT